MKRIIRLTESDLSRIVRRIIRESENKQAEMAIENCDENNDMAMERCVDNLFADMTEKDAENYIKELSMQKPQWLIKLIRWFRRTGKQIRREVKRTKPAERFLNVGALVTFATISAFLIKYMDDFFNHKNPLARLNDRFN